MDVEGLDPVRIMAAFRAHGVRTVVVGGMAALAHGSVTPTDDVDIAVADDDDNLDRLALALQQIGARPVTDDASGGSGSGPRESFATLGGRLDCIMLSVAVFDPMYERGSEIHVGHGVSARVASIADLADLKRRSGDLGASVRIAAFSGEADDIVTRVPEIDPSDDGEAPGTGMTDKVWRALEGVDRFLTNLVDR